MQQHYELGQFLRKRYEKLLGNGEYSVNKVFVYSTVCIKNQILLIKIKSSHVNVTTFHE